MTNKILINFLFLGFERLKPASPQGNDGIRLKHQEEGTQALRSLCTPGLRAADEESFQDNVRR